MTVAAPVDKALRLDVRHDVAGGPLVLVELLGDEHAELHPGLLHQPVHPGYINVFMNTCKYI